MSSITKQKMGKYTYLYESTSFRNDQGRPRNKKIKIGKIDPYTGDTIYTPEYTQRLSASQVAMPPEKQKKDPAQKEVIEILDNIKDYGVYWFLSELAKKIGLLEILQLAFPAIWKEIFTLACYLIVSDKPVMYCEDWLSENEGFDVEASNMSSQRVSDLLCSFGEMDRNTFYRAWYKHIQEHEYVALDITSISSYSQQRVECEWGHNRDGENLPQTNLCMLFGQTTRVPIFQTSYSGSLGDVSTLECTTAKFQAMFGKNESAFIMDKGFYSRKNINMLLSKDIRFLVSVPFTNSFAKNQVEIERTDIDKLDNIIITSGEPIRGVHKIQDWDNEGTKLHIHIYFDPEKALKDRNELFALITKLKKIVITRIDYDKYKTKIERYLVIVESEKAENGYTINVREDMVAHALETSGWFILISNHMEDTQQAFDSYRMKDVVEKGFWKYKNNLGLDRLRVHTDERAENKTFVAFIALILSSYVHNTMKDKQLYDLFTFDRLFLTLAKLKSVCISGKRILRPLTRQQRVLFKAYDLPFPVG